MQALWIDTPLDPMLAISDDTGLYLLEFVGRRGLDQAIEKLCLRKNAAIVFGKTTPIDSIKKELDTYFLGNLTSFKTPLHTKGEKNE